MGERMVLLIGLIWSSRLVDHLMKYGGSMEIW